MSNNEITLDLLKELDQLRSDIVLFELNKKQNEKAIESLRTKIKDKEALIELEKNRVSEFQNDFCNSKNYTEKELLKGRSEEEQFYLKDLLTLFAEKKRLLDEKQPFEEIKNTKIQEEREKEKRQIEALGKKPEYIEINEKDKLNFGVLIVLAIQILFTVLISTQLNFKNGVFVFIVVLIIALVIYGITLGVIIGIVSDIIKYYRKILPIEKSNAEYSSLTADYEKKVKQINQECEKNIKLIEKEFNSRKDY